MSKQKYYVVWKGRTRGVYDNWEDCKKQILAYEGAVYKSFKTKQLAEKAFQSSSTDYIGKDFFESELTEQEKQAIGSPILNSISVDGAWNTATGIVEYQGVHTKSKEIIFKKGPFEDGTNNIVEFLAIVHALAYCKQHDLNLPIYSDSRNAISWVCHKEARTKHIKNEKNQELFALLERAITWLKINSYSNKILKWETKAWGENPADFDRK